MHVDIVPLSGFLHFPSLTHEHYRPIHLWADHRGFPERDIQRMVGGVQDDPIL